MPLNHFFFLVKRKATTGNNKLSVQDFAKKKQDGLTATIDMEEIPPELVLNWDQTGIKLVPVSAHTMDKQGSACVEVAGAKDKRLITALFCGSLTGGFVPVQVIYHGKTNRCYPKYKFPTDWHSPKHWSNETTMIGYINEVVLPYVSSQRSSFGEEKPAVVIMDNFKG